MTKQKEIREGMIEILKDGVINDTPFGETADAIMRKESSQGVVIKAEDQTIQVEIPADGKRTGLKVPYHLENLGKNIVAVEPLIEK